MNIPLLKIIKPARKRTRVHEYVQSLESSQVGAGFFGERRGVGLTASETDDDRSVSPLMCTYLPIGELCHSGDLCLKKKNPPTHYRFHHLPDTLRSNTFSRAGRSASRRQSQASRYLSLPRSPVCEVKKTPDLSPGRVREHHLFSFTLPSLSRRKIILYIYE